MGVQIPDLLPPDSPPNVPRFDVNPEHLRIDSKGQSNSQPLNVNTGAIITSDPDAGVGIIGVLDYGFRTYTILPEPDTKLISYGGMEQAVPIRRPKEGEFTIGSFNMENFYDDVPNGWSGEVVMSRETFNDRLNKASPAIREVMQSPDIIGVQEVENLETLQRVAAKILRDGGPHYQAELVEVNNPGNINVGFLRSRVTDVTVTQVLRDERFAVCEPCTPACRNYSRNSDCTQVLYDRPPLLLQANIRQKPRSAPLPIMRSSTPFYLKDLAALIVELYGRGEFRLIPFPPERKAIDVGDYYADYRSIRSKLGWTPKVSLRQGLERTLAFYQKYHSHYGEAQG